MNEDKEYDIMQGSGTDISESLDDYIIRKVKESQNTLLEQIKEEIESIIKSPVNPNIDHIFAEGHLIGLEDTLSIIDKYINK